MKQISSIFLLTICFGLTFCKKDKGDSVTSHNINGQVFNLCTDSGLVNCTVFLKEKGNTLAQVNSGASGNFTFSNVQIHSSSDYTYDLEVQSVSGIGGGTQPAIDGAAIELNKNNLNQSFKLNVVPHAGNIRLFFPNGTILTSNDTFVLTIQQPILHQNTSYSNWQLIWPCPPPPPTNFLGNIGDYWMGWWHTSLDKTHNGIHTVTTHNFYVGWWTNVTDTIPW